MRLAQLVLRPVQGIGEQLNLVVYVRLAHNSWERTRPSRCHHKRAETNSVRPQACELVSQGEYGLYENFASLAPLVLNSRERTDSSAANRRAMLHTKNGFSGAAAHQYQIAAVFGRDAMPPAVSPRPDPFCLPWLTNGSKRLLRISFPERQPRHP